MEQFGEVSIGGNISQMIKKYSGMTEEESQKHINDYDRHKSRFLNQLGWGRECEYSFLCSEDVENWQEFYEVLMTQFSENDDVTFTCPVFATECVYIEVPGCQYGIQISHEPSTSIACICWNQQDQVALTQWIEEKL